MKFHYVECGSKSQPLLLLLHGFPDCWLGWRYQISFFSKYFRVVAVDLKGFGDSDKPVWRTNYKVQTLSEELKQFVNTLGASSCIIMGHDLGGLLAWHMAYQNPDLVNKFIVISCPHPNFYWENIETRHVDILWIYLAQCPYLPELEALKDDIKIIEKCHSHLQVDSRANEILEAYKYVFSRKEDWWGPINYFRNLPFVRIAAESEQINVPVLMLTGNKNKCIKLEAFVKSTDYCEKCFIKIIDGGGYFPHQEVPNTFNELVLKFLNVSPNTHCGKQIDKLSSRRFMNSLMGAVTTTVKYGNSVIDSVSKRTNGVVGVSNINFTLSGDTNTAT